jgi:hypothetical protein
VVHAAQDEIGACGEERLDREEDTVRRGAVDLPPPVTPLHRAHGMVQRQRVAGRALLAVRRHDVDVTERFGGPHQRVEPVGEDAVVVRAEQAHVDVRRPREIADRSEEAFPCSVRAAGAARI